jgi:uncharacterized protein YifE (UPF0438 family)
MTSREAHRGALSQPFTAPFRASEFTAEELAVISKHGAWMEALATGKLRPLTQAQSHFLEVASGRSEPTTLHEKVWLKLAAAREPSFAPFAQAEGETDRPTATSPVRPNARQVLALARADKLTLPQLRQVVDRSNEFSFTTEELSELQAHLLEKGGASSRAWSNCVFCQGDGGPGGRCSRCGGTGIEP